MNIFRLNKTTVFLSAAVIGLSLVLMAQFLQARVYAQVQNPQSGEVGLQGQISAPPPTTAPTISAPGNNTTTSEVPINMRGICTDGLLVKLFKNNIFSGSVVCSGGSYTIIVDLFSGRNELVVRHFDDLNQEGPDSNLVVINYDDGSKLNSAFERVTMTTIYAKRGADTGDVLTWPLIITGGSAPYAVSVDWGDGGLADVYAVEFPGDFVIKHKYEQAGVYRVLIKATDKEGRVGFIQVIAIANGEIDEARVAGAIDDINAGPGGKTRILWEPVVLIIPFIITTFYLGKKYEITRIKKNLQRGDHPF